MKFFKKIFLGICAVLFFLISFDVSLASSDGESIEEFYVSMRVNKDSSIRVTESIYYDFSRNHKHGIYRNIPLNYSIEGEKGKIRISNVSVVDGEGGRLDYEKNGFGGMMKIKIGDPDITITGKKKYVISYTVRGAILDKGDRDEIYWNATGDEWEVSIKKAEVKVLFDNSFENGDLKIDCFSGSRGSKNACKISGHAFVDRKIAGGFYASDNLWAGNGMSVVVNFPKGVVDGPKFSLWYFILDYFYVILPVLSFLVMFCIWFRNGRDKEGRGTIIPQYEEPDGMIAAGVGVLYDDRAENKDISAGIIQLAVKGYIKIVRVKSEKFYKDDDYILERINSDASGLSSFEQSLLTRLFSKKNRKLSVKDIKKEMIKQGLDKNSFIFKTLSTAMSWSGDTDELEVENNDNVVKLSSLKYKFADDVQRLKEKLYGKMASKGYYKKNPEKVRGVYVLIGILTFMIGMVPMVGMYDLYGVFGLLVTVFVILFFGYYMPARTKKGSLAREHVLGLKMYLSVAEKDRIEFHNNPKSDPKTFERLLPFAMVLGVEKEWAKQFEDIYLNEPSWYSSNSSSFNTVNFAGSLRGFANAAESNLSASHSSGSGGGAGGGCGGGGGGSW